MNLTSSSVLLKQQQQQQQQQQQRTHEIDFDRLYIVILSIYD